MTGPLITTIIPTYRRPQMLKRAISSILSQTYPHFEVRVYDNASCDETAFVVDELARQDPRIKYFAHIKNIGATQNFEYGMLKVQTPFFSILADDDILLPQFYEIALAGFDRYPQAGFSGGAVISMTNEGKFIALARATDREFEFFTPPAGVLKMITHYINWTGILFRHAVIQEMKVLDHEVKPIDVDFVLKAASRFSYVVNSKPVAIFVHHSTSYSGTCGLKLVWPSWNRMIESLKKEKSITASSLEQVELLMRQKLGQFLTALGIQSIINQDLQETNSIADVLAGQGYKFRSGFMQLAAEKNIILQKLLFLFTLLVYKMFKYFKNLKTRKNVQEYRKWLNQENCPCEKR